jgi:hypothetical protein
LGFSTCGFLESTVEVDNIESNLEMSLSTPQSQSRAGQGRIGLKNLAITTRNHQASVFDDKNQK